MMPKNSWVQASIIQDLRVQLHPSHPHKQGHCMYAVTHLFILSTSLFQPSRGSVLACVLVSAHPFYRFFRILVLGVSSDLNESKISLCIYIRRRSFNCKLQKSVLYTYQIEEFENEGSRRANS